MLSASAKVLTSHRPLSRTGSSDAPISTLGASGREGPFQVFASANRRPSVRIQNDSDIILRFVLRGSDGKDLSMDIAPHSDGVLQADVGHYEASVLDPTGLVHSAAGDATFLEFHEYRNAFWVGDDLGRNDFHIGD